MLARSFLALVLTCLAPFAQAADWMVERTAREVHYSLDGQSWQPLQQGMDVPDNAWISTGQSGRVILARGSERIVLRPGTIAGLQFWGQGDSQTQITQTSGAILLSLVTRNQPHTTVQTPHLAAIVKGTVFEVAVTPEGSSVRVDRGRVSVRDRRSGRETDTTAAASPSRSTCPRSP